MGLTNNLGKLSNMITSTGSAVGIAQPSPSYTLDVSGTGRFTSTLLVSGNVGIGVTPSSQAFAGLQSLQIMNSLYFGYLNRANVLANAYVTSSGALNYIATDFATRYEQFDGKHQFSTAPSGTAATAITFTPRLLIDNSGNVGIGTSTFNYSSAGRGDLAVNGTTDSILELQANSSTIAYLYAGTSNVDLRCFASRDLTFSTTGGERMRITSDGAIKNDVAGGANRYATNVPEISQAANTHCQVMNQRNASFSATGFGVLGMAVDRAATSAYSFGGWYSNLAVSADKEFDFRGDGNGFCDGSWTGGGADYAEYFEWLDGNLDNEDRRGYSVSLINNKIKIAEKGETIIGVISGNPSVVGDAAWNKWSGKYLKDDFGSYILDEEGNRTLNPNYNPDEEYIPREQRPEWSVVGLMGKLRIRKGQKTMPTWIKMRDVSENVEEWLIK